VAVGEAPPLAAVLVGVAAAPPATAAELVLGLPASAGVAAIATIVKLQKIALRVRTRTTTTSFVGLRG
jgi:hypothetical protein